MSEFPKLKVNWPIEGYPSQDIRDFEQAKYFLPFSSPAFILVEGQVINSYKELVQLATQDCYKDKEFLEVLVAEAIGGG